MKKGILKTILLTSILLSSLGSIVYAATLYRIGIPHTSKYVYLEDKLNDSTYSKRLDNAMSYWSLTSTKIGIWKTYR